METGENIPLSTKKKNALKDGAHLGTTGGLLKIFHSIFLSQHLPLYI